MILVNDGGALRVEVDEADLPSVEGAGADLELWLIDPDPDGVPEDLVSLGPLDPVSPGPRTVPASIDPATFSVVDISVEPRDGDPTHSGRSILGEP